MREALPRWLLCFLLLPFSSNFSWAGALVGRHTWSGTVRVEEDVLIPSGSSLEIQPGTRVVFAVSPGTKTDPSYWNSGTELAVEGTLAVLGTAERPVTFEGEGPWGGLVAAPGAAISLEHARIQGAQEAVLCVGSECSLREVNISGCEYGVVLGPGARPSAERVAITGSRVGLLDLRGAAAGPLELRIDGAADAGELSQGSAAPATEAAVALPVPGASVELLGDYTVERSETWKGEVVISGRVTVVPGAVLTVQAGTRVAFRRRDSNGDGLGEGELMVLGGIRCLGSAEAPVVFESAEAQPRPGDWDKVSLISSEDPDNLLRYAVFRHGTQALHAHFSQFAAEDCYFEANLRGAQFQESVGARLRRCVFRGNKQALRFRDSTVAVSDSVFTGNLYAVHSFRCELEFTGNTLDGNALGGFFAREGRVRLTGNRLSRSRDGARLRDPGSRVEIRGNRFEGNAEDGLSLSQVEGVVEDNVLDGAGLDLVSVEASAVSFRGNSFGAAGRDALHLKGTLDLDARGNDWGASNPAARIHDHEDDPALGKVRWEPVAKRPSLGIVPTVAW